MESAIYLHNGLCKVQRRSQVTTVGWFLRIGNSPDSACQHRG